MSEPAFRPLVTATSGFFYAQAPGGLGMPRPTSLASQFPPPRPGLNPKAALRALAAPVRWQLLLMMAAGQNLNATEAAKALRLEFDGVARHFRVMLAAGLVELVPGGDRRSARYFIPNAYRPEPGVLDYGFCLIRVPGAP